MLYINNKVVDTNDTVSFTFTNEQLDNPSALKNSFSRQITLARTPNNDIALGYNNLAENYKVKVNERMPFEYYNKDSELVQKGYCRIDSFDKEYKLTLYGSLGDYMYTLASRRLSDLHYCNDDDEVEITPQSVKDAWDYAYTMDSTIDDYGIHDVFNFTPAYNGLPDDSNKVVVQCDKLPLPDSIEGMKPIEVDNKSYALITSTQKFNEWQVKDLRCYKQRPIFRLNAFLKAISSVGDWSTEYHFDQRDLGLMQRMWVTLPLIDRELMKSSEIQVTGDDTFDELQSVATPSTSITSQIFELPRGVESTVDFLTLNSLIPYFPTLTDGNRHYLHKANCRKPSFFIATINYYKGTELIGESGKYYYTTASNEADYKAYMSQIDGKPISNDWDQAIYSGDDGGEWLKDTFISEPTPYGTTAFSVTMEFQSGIASNGSSFDFNDMSLPSFGLKLSSGSCSWSRKSIARATTITKEHLFNSFNIDASKLLLSITKLFHWRFLAKGNVMHIYSVGQFYNDPQPVNISNHINRLKSQILNPLALTYRYYNHTIPAIGYNAVRYKELNGVEYGSHYYDCHYKFNDNDYNFLADSVFKGCCTVVEHDERYLQSTYPSFTRYEAELTYGSGDVKKSMKWNIPIRDYMEDKQDDFSKIQLYDKEMKPIGGEGVLLLYDVQNNRPIGEYSITDDNEAMLILNDKKPCWFYGDALTTSSIPQFKRYIVQRGVATITVDFSTPIEHYDDYITRIEGNLYSRWYRFIELDRYNEQCKLFSCYVRASALPDDFMRKFYWFDNSLWVLNTVKGLSSERDGEVQCEFIKVKDMGNYNYRY